jgi:c-di-GMP-binding flagellar brake protein YcgR
MDPNLNRRSFYRLRMNPPRRCYFQAPGGGLARDAALLDLGAGGCQVRTTVDFPVSGQEGRISFDLAGETWDLKGRIVWKRHGLTTFFYGVRFSGRTTAEEDRLIRAIFAEERDLRPRS